MGVKSTDDESSDSSRVGNYPNRKFAKMLRQRGIRFGRGLYHLNPVRARIVRRPPVAYGWSSYQDYLGVRKAAAWLDWQTALAEVAKDRSRARSAHRHFVEAGLSEPPTSREPGTLGGDLPGAFDER
jgi:hypothetical protein